MTDIIMAHQGTIDEFIGDAILAVFGAPQRRDDDADRAVHCALAMQAAMAEINALNRAEGLPEIDTGIALNTGDVIAGNIGSERRSKYGFVGHPMNVTSRIEDVTAGGEILAADSTLQKPGGHISHRQQPGDQRQGYRPVHRRPPDPGSGRMRSRAHARCSAPCQAQEAAMTRPILLVEDNELNREMLLRRLQPGRPHGDYRRRRPAGAGPDGERTPALVLMDMSLPVLDGWTACRMARQDERIRHIPIIALTAHAMEQDRLKALTAGCDDYATKPVDFPELLNKIGTLSHS